MSGLDDRSKIVKFYRAQGVQRRRALPDLTGFSLTNVCQGLGDTVILSDLPKSSAAGGKPVRVFSNSRHFEPLMQFNPWWVRGHEPLLVDAPSLVHGYQCGNGHYIQRIQRAFGLPIDRRPKGTLEVPGTAKDPFRVIMHWEAGEHANWQAKHVHPRPRQLYPESRLMIEEFIAQSPTYEFIEIGHSPVGIKGAEIAQGLTLRDTIKLMASCSYFIGIISGPMHLATALGLKCVVVINFPHPELIFLPTLVDTGQVESEWFYPQNVHLHQEGQGAQIERLSVNALHAAMDGAIYPYWSEAFLDLINERL